MNAQPPRIAARNARNRQRDRALRAALTADPTPLEAVILSLCGHCPSSPPSSSSALTQRHGAPLTG